MSKSTRRVDEIRCDAGVLPRCGDPGFDLLTAVSRQKLGIKGRLRYWQFRLGGIIPALRQRIREYFLARHAKKLATAWLVANIPPHILAIHPDKLSSEHLMALRIIIDKEWREFDAMSPASVAEVEEWLYGGCFPPSISAAVLAIKADTERRYTAPTQPISDVKGIPTPDENVTPQS